MIQIYINKNIIDEIINFNIRIDINGDFIDL